MTTTAPDTNARTFMERCLVGDAQPEAVDDAIDAWHESRGGMALVDWLGFDAREMALWMREPRLLGRLVERRRRASGGNDSDDVARDVAHLGLPQEATRDDVVATIAALLKVGRAMGHQSCAVAEEALSRCLSEDIDGRGALTVAVTVAATTKVSTGPGRQRTVRLDGIGVPRG